MKHLFITGIMRSGTTGISNFLNAQKNITIYRDYPNFLRRIPAKYFQVDTLDEVKKNVLISNLKAEYMSLLRKNIDIHPKDFENIFGLYKILLLSIGNQTDKIIGHKLTESLNILERFIRHDSFLGIYMLRDVRDVILSTKNRFFSYSVVSMIIKWKKEIEKIISLKKKYPNFMIIKYEDFVLKNIKKELSHFLQLEIDWNIKKFKDRNGFTNWAGNTSYAVYDKKEISKGLYTKSINNWHKEIDKDPDLQLAECLSKKELKAFGYELSNIDYNKLNFLKYKSKYHSKQYLQQLKSFLKKLGL